MSKRIAWTCLAAASCAIVLVACGSSHKSSSTSASRNSSPALEFANCMRTHGVPRFPDPGSRGGFDLAAGVNPQSPAFRSARHACAHLAPGGGSPGAQATQGQFLTALGFAKCMRKHGFPDFPDPTRFDAPPGPILIVGDGLFFRVSASLDPNTPVFKRAVAACGEG